MPNAKITELNTIAEAVYPQVSAGISSSVLVDMRDFSRYCAVVSHGTATTASTLVVKVYESSASTWGGAVATLLSTTTVSVGTATTTVAKVDVKAADLASANRYLGVYITKTDTASALSAITIASDDRYLG
jgi:hypothetical protein